MSKKKSTAQKPATSLEVFRSVRKPVPPPGKPLRNDKRQQTSDPSRRQIKHRGHRLDD